MDTANDLEWFSSIVRHFMAQRRLDDDQVAQLVGKDRSTVIRWRTGETMPGKGELLRVLKILGFDINRLAPTYSPLDDAINLLQEEVRHYGSTKSLNKNKKAELTDLLAKAVALREAQQKPTILDDKTRNEVIREYLQSNLNKLPDVEVE